ncbi:MAG TPA: hypothetical protein VEZ15_17705, partial [Acidimicrobiia bacterium]|nr:hypothetical protein [Acidimicrobiia bacterium]
VVTELERLADGCGQHCGGSRRHRHSRGCCSRTARSSLQDLACDCRLGVLIWGAGAVELHGLAVSAPRDHAVVADQSLELTGNQLDGDVWMR